MSKQNKIKSNKQIIIYRGELAPFENQRCEFIGDVTAMGVGVNGGKFPTILIENIRHEGKTISKHAWIHSKLCDLSTYKPGDTIRFTAVVTKYTTGYRKWKNGSTPGPRPGYCFAGVITRGRLSDE